MFISDSEKFIYFHIPKTAGSSISSSSSPQNFNQLSEEHPLKITRDSKIVKSLSVLNISGIQVS